MDRRALALLGLGLVSGCKGAETHGENGAGAQRAGLTLTGAGATFPYPLYSKWAAEFAKLKKGIQINYQSIGSGGGIRQITERTVDFGASDAPMTDEQIEKAKGVVHIPTCLGAVTIAYNLEGVPSGLKLTPELVAGMFLGTIKQWNDPELQKENPDALLPDKPISTVHRSDGSGTTKIFADFLSAVPAWQAGPGTGTSVNWPTGLGAKGNEGVAGQVKSTPGALGYVELAYAVQNKMTFAALKNKSGRYVLPSLESTTAAAEGALAKIPEDFRTSIVNPEGETSYPIASFTYLLVYEVQKDTAKGKALVEFLNWSLGEGQRLASGLDYAPLPESIRKRAIDKSHTFALPTAAPSSRRHEDGARTT